jgi:hypothetical protein
VENVFTFPMIYMAVVIIAGDKYYLDIFIVTNFSLLCASLTEVMEHISGLANAYRRTLC